MISSSLISIERLTTGKMEKLEDLFDFINYLKIEINLF